MNELAQYTLTFVLGLASFLFVVRFLLQLMRVDFYNPLCQGIVRITDPVLKPLRLVLPGIRNFDTASFVIATLVQAILIVALTQVGDINVLAVLISSVIRVLMLAITILKWSIIIVIIASFVAPGNYHPALALLHELTEPVLAPARKLLPAMGGIDFSPILVFFVLTALETIILPGIHDSLFNML